jgi:hypothetical protein
MKLIGKLNTKLEVLMKGNKNNLVLSFVFAVLHVVLFTVFNVIDFGTTPIAFYGPLVYFTAGVASFSYFLKYKQGKSLLQKLSVFIA